MDANKRINKMNHVRLSHNLKIQMLCPTIQINYPNLHNPTRCVYNHINKFWKVCNLEGGVWISIPFVQIWVVDFDNSNVVINKHIFGLHKLIKALTIFNMGKIHGKPRLYQCHTNLTNWPWPILETIINCHLNN
jgi:hypothetical protein